MLFAEKLNRSTGKNNSLLCVGLDSDYDKLPKIILNSDEPQLDFNRAIIDATADLVCAYKPNSAFYEARGADGVSQLQKTIGYIKDNYPDIPVILDAKRADIGNTNNGYVKYAFEYLGVDAITLQPYLGKAALQPFLDRKDKGLIILCRNSNEGGDEFQGMTVDGRPLYQQVAEHVSKDWNTNGNCMLVTGATYPEEMKAIREIVGSEMLFLVPGVGAQGGNLESAMRSGQGDGKNNLVINSSRGVIFASNGQDFAEAARASAEKLRDEINKFR